MSYEIGHRILNLQPTPRVGRTEYFDHPTLASRILGEPLIPGDPEQNAALMRRFYEWLEFDLMWLTYDGPMWTGRWTNMGHAEYMEGGVDMNRDVRCPFEDGEEVLAFDAVAEYGLPDRAERAAHYQEIWEANQRNVGDMLLPGGYYKTIVSGAIQAFGWDMLLEAAGMDLKRFGRDTLEGIFKVTQANTLAWLDTTIECFICHDDMVWTEGAIFKPEFYREYIFPRYRELWRPFKEKGIKVLFCSDGNYTEFIDDIAWAGADGFIFEPMTSLEYIAEKYGQTHVIVGNADCRPMTFGTREQVRAEVERCMRAAKHCPGFIMAVGNHIPYNVQDDLVMYYFDLVREMGAR